MCSVLLVKEKKMFHILHIFCFVYFTYFGNFTSYASAFSWSATAKSFEFQQGQGKLASDSVVLQFVQIDPNNF